MLINFDSIYNYTLRNIKRALGEAEPLRDNTSMTNDFPGYSKIRPCDYQEGEFVTLFLDMRDSTKRALSLGAKKTFVTIQALLPSLAKIVEGTDGFVVEYPGDGIMAHWDMEDDPVKAITDSVKAASWMEDCVKNIVNPILAQCGIPPIKCAIGIAAGRVIITKLGIPGTIVTKAIGDSINRAAKLTKADVNPEGIRLDFSMADRAFSNVSPNEESLFSYNPNPDNTITIFPTQKLSLHREPNVTKPLYKPLQTNFLFPNLNYKR